MNSKARTAPTGTSVVVHLLEQGTLEGLRAAKEATRKLIDYHWKFYSELALQRSQIESELADALNEAAIENFSFSKWQRAVRYRYSLHPLSVLGSLKDPGSRFNIGDIDAARFPQLFCTNTCIPFNNPAHPAHFRFYRRGEVLRRARDDL